MSELTQYDAAIIGGGPAGLAAALNLGRAGRRTVLVDSGVYRNAPAQSAHGMLTRDGESPAEIRRAGRRELERYGVTLVDTRVSDAWKEEGGFRLTLDEGADLASRVLIVATGVVDDLPEIPGVREAWGHSVVHCPYCHGAEHRGEPTAVLGRGESTYYMARLLKGWTDDITVVTNGPEEIDDEQEETLRAEGIAMLRTPIARVAVDGVSVRGVEFVDGTSLDCRVVYVHPPQHFASPIAERLGAEVNDDGRIEAGPEGRTRVPGLYVAGDIVNAAQQVATAVGGGTLAGLAANRELICGPPD